MGSLVPPLGPQSCGHFQGQSRPWPRRTSRRPGRASGSVTRADTRSPWGVGTASCSSVCLQRVLSGGAGQPHPTRVTRKVLCPESRRRSSTGKCIGARRPGWSRDTVFTKDIGGSWGRKAGSREGSCFHRDAGTQGRMQ